MWSGFTKVGWHLSDAMKRENACKLWSSRVGHLRCLLRYILSTNAPSTDHPFFVGLQAHPEFCTRPLNPSPPFLGFVAAACGPDVLEQQMAQQLQSFQPPHPEKSMIGEQQLIQGSREQVPTAGRERVLSVSGGSR